MKAKEWVEKLKNNLVGGLDDYIQETLDLTHKRGRSPLAIEGAVREQREKFKAIIRLLPDLDIRYFDDAMEYTCPADWKVFMDVELSLWKRRGMIAELRRYQMEKAQLEQEPDPVIRLDRRIANMMERWIRMRELEEV